VNDISSDLHKEGRMPHINGLSHPQDPYGGGSTNTVESNVTLATMSIGSGVVAGTLAGVDASEPALAALSHVTLPVSAFLSGIPIPGFTTLALLTRGSLDLWIFIFAFVSVGLATTNLYLGFWMKRRTASEYAKVYNLAEEELHKNEKLTADLNRAQQEKQELEAKLAAQSGTPSLTGGLPNPQTDNRTTKGDEHDHEQKSGSAFPRSVG